LYRVPDLLARARELDAADALAPFRERFVIPGRGNFARFSVLLR
jgi:hypothetical protein